MMFDLLRCTTITHIGMEMIEGKNRGWAVAYSISISNFEASPAIISTMS